MRNHQYDYDQSHNQPTYAYRPLSHAHRDSLNSSAVGHVSGHVGGVSRDSIPPTIAEPVTPPSPPCPPVVSKLDLEEMRLKSTRLNGFHNATGTDSSDTEEEERLERERCRLLTIKSGPPLELDKSPKKLKFLKTFGLTTQQSKQEIEFEKYVERRVRRHEKNSAAPAQNTEVRSPPSSTTVTPVQHTLDTILGTGSNGISSSAKKATTAPVRDDSRYPDDTSRYPDEKTEDFLTRNFQLERVNKDKIRVHELIWEAIIEERSRRNGYFVPALKHLQQEWEQQRKSPSKEAEIGRGVKRKFEQEERENGNISGIIPSSLTMTSDYITNTNKKCSIMSSRIITARHLKRSVVHPPNSRFGEWDKHVAELPPSSSGSVQSVNNVVNHSERRVVLMTSSTTEVNKKQLNKDFVQEFHESVLQTTQQQQAMKLAGEGHLRPIADISRSSSLGPPILTDSRISGSVTPVSPPPQSSTEGASSLFKWPGIEAVMEAYERHTQEQKLEKEVLNEQFTCLRTRQQDLNSSTEQLRQRMGDLIGVKRKLDEDRQGLQRAIDNLKRCLRQMR